VSATLLAGFVFLVGGFFLGGSYVAHRGGVVDKREGRPRRQSVCLREMIAGCPATGVCGAHVVTPCR